MAEEQSATFALDLDDGISGPAESAIDALNKLQSQMKRDSQELANLQKAMRNLQGGTTVNIQQFRALKQAIDAKKGAIAEAQSAFISLGGRFDATGSKGRAFADRLKELQATTQTMPGPIGGLMSSLGRLKELVGGSAMVVGLAALAAGFVALTVAVVGATAALLKYGIAAAGARRSEALRLEGLTKMRNWFGLAAGNASEMQAAIDRVSGSTTLGRDKLEQYTGELYRMGLRGQNLSSALEAAAIKGSVLGDAGAKSAMGWAAAMAWSGKSVQRFADDVKARFGGIVAAQMLDLDVQAHKMRENFGALFSGLKIDALLRAISSVTSLFGQSTASGRALRSIMQTLFQPMVDAIAYVAPIVKRFFQGILIGGLVVGIGLLYVRKIWRQVFGSKDLVDSGYLMRVALGMGVAAAVALTVVLAPLVAAVAAIGAQFYLAAVAGSFLWKWIGKAYDAVVSVDWIGAGKAIVNGLVSGVKSAGKWLLDTVGKLGTDALKAIREKLGIASPSKEFARLGIEIPRGLEAGIERGAPDARAAVANVVEAPAAPARAAASPSSPAAARAGGPTTVTINLGGITIPVAERPDAESVVAELERRLADILEGVAIQLGAALPGGA